MLMELGEGWEIVSADYNRSSEMILVTVKETDEMWKSEACPLCNRQAVSPYDHLENRFWTHLSAFGKKVLLSCAMPRGKCAYCGNIYRLNPDWSGKSKYFTRGFEAYALTLMKDLPVKKVSKISGEGDQRLWRILFANVDGAFNEVSSASTRILRQQWKQTSPVTRE